MSDKAGSKKKQSAAAADQQPLLGIDIQSSYQNDDADYNNSAPSMQPAVSLTSRTSSDPHSSNQQQSNQPFSNPVYYSPTANLRQPLLSQVINLKQSNNSNSDFLLNQSDDDTTHNPLANNSTSDYVYTSQQQIPPHNPAANYTFVRNRPEEEWPNIHTLSKNAKSLLSKGAKKTQRKQPVTDDHVFDDLDYICIGSAVVLSIVWLILYLTQPQLDDNEDGHGNTLHAYLGTVVLTVCVYYSSALLELYTIHFLWLLNNSRFWKLYYYGQVLGGSLKWLTTLIFVYYVHHYNVFIVLPPSTLRFLDPMLTFVILSIAAGMVRQFWIKLVTYRMNAATYSTLVEEMYFKHNVLKRLANPRSYYQIVRPIHAPPSSTSKPSGMSRSTSSGTLAVLQTKQEEQAQGQNVPGSGFTQFFSKLRASHHDSDETPVPVGSEHFSKKIKATALARKVFSNVDRQNKGYIIASDFQNFLPEKTAISAYDMIIHSVMEEQAAGRGLPDDAGDDDSGENESTKAKPPTPFQLQHVEKEAERLKALEAAQIADSSTSDASHNTDASNSKPDANSNDSASSDRSVSFAPDTNLTSPASSPIVKPADLPVVPASSANRASSRATTAATSSPTLQQQQPPIQRTASAESALQKPADSSAVAVEPPAEKVAKTTSTVKKVKKTVKKLKSALTASSATNNQASSVTSVTGDTIDIGNFRLTEKQLTTVVLRYYKDYKKLLDTIKNTNGLSSVIDSLSQMFYWIVVTFAMTIAFNQYYKQQNFVITLSTVFFSLTFVFSQSLRDMFTAIVFLFYLKPYAVGDRVDVGTAKYRVVSIQLLTTTFRTLDSRITTMPNSSLASATITNLSKSKQAVAKWSFFVEMNTSCSKLAQLRQRLVEHIEANPKDWASNVSMNFNNVLPNTNSLQISLWLKSKHFYTDVKLVKRAKTEVLHVVREAMLDLNITWVYPGVDVNVLDQALLLNAQPQPDGSAPPKLPKGGGGGGGSNSMMSGVGGMKGMKLGRGGKRAMAANTNGQQPQQAPPADNSDDFF